MAVSPGAQERPLLEDDTKQSSKDRCVLKYPSSPVTNPEPMYGHSVTWHFDAHVITVGFIVRSRLEASDEKKIHGLSPRANYTDRAIAACRRSDHKLFADRGCHVVSVTDPYCRILGFLEMNRNFSIK
jgi:hypothetical protein